MPERLAAPIRVLIVEDNPLDAELALSELHDAGMVVESKIVWTEPRYRTALAEFAPDVILCDFAFPEFDGETALRIARTEYPFIPFIFVSGTLSEERLAIALQNGASDYIQKSRPIRLPSAILRALERATRQRLLHAAAMRVARLGRIRDVMASVDRAIIRVRDRNALFDEVCRIVTEVGQFPLAAIAWTDSPPQPAIVASAGLGPMFEDLLGIVAASVERTEQPFVVNDATQLDSMPRRDELLSEGMHAIAAFPLTLKNKTQGAMIIAEREAGFFDREEIEMASDVAGNLSFAIELLNEQQRVVHLSRVRDVLAAASEAIVRASDSERLYADVCHIALEVAGYATVFITEVDEQGSVRIACAAGSWAADSRELQVAMAAIFKAGRGPTFAALRTLRPAFLNDLQSAGDDIFPPPPGTRVTGTRAIGTFPLVVEGRGVGTLSFDATDSGSFDDEEVELLTHLAANLSLGLDLIRRRERHDRLSRIRDVLSAANFAILRLHARPELCREVCRIAVEVGGFKSAIVAEFGHTSGKVAIPSFLASSGSSAPNESVWQTLRGEDSRSLGRGGAHEIASFPIIVEEKAVGAIVFVRDVNGQFDAPEVALLTEIANNLAFGFNLLEKQQRVDFLSFYDTMTALPNRALFFQRVERDIAACKVDGKLLVVAVVDIVRFSSVNSTHGEHVGDELLRKVAGRLREQIGESRIARIAGDKFAVSFPQLDDLRALAAFVTDEGLKLFENPFVVEGHNVRLKGRAGAAVFPSDGDRPAELLQNAEAALANAKAADATYRFFAQELNTRIAKQLDLEARLQRAIDGLQFVLFYQPKVDIETRKLTGFEALLRWNDPERGLVMPNDFIPLLERSGMMLPVGRWALAEAARQFEEWRSAGLKPPRIAINLSTMQLRQERLIDDIRAAAEGTSEICAGLDFEVTESMLLENMESAIAKLTAIKALGAKISLDDFGTGYSSLAYIHQLPLDALKIDRAFINGMFDDVNKRSVVRTIILLAEALDLTTIAEGVESERDAQLLKLLRCDQIQGYLIAKPVPAEQAVRFLIT